MEECEKFTLKKIRPCKIASGFGLGMGVTPKFMAYQNYKDLIRGVEFSLWELWSASKAFALNVERIEGTNNLKFICATAMDARQRSMSNIHPNCMMRDCRLDEEGLMLDIDMSTNSAPTLLPTTLSVVMVCMMSEGRSLASKQPSVISHVSPKRSPNQSAGGFHRQDRPQTRNRSFPTERLT